MSQGLAAVGRGGRPTATAACVLLAVAACAAFGADGAPDLPAGLAPQTRPAASESPSGPAVPDGLVADEASDGGPALPSGLDGDATSDVRADADAERATFPLEVTGFVEFRGSVRTQHDPGQRQASLGETRLQLELQEYVEGLTFTVRTDLLYDAVGERQAIDLERGRGWLDLREASVAFDPADWMSVKFGRQILTWGTGDLLFLNDMFPKDWQSFFVGRDVEYLKAPSDAVKISIFTDPLNADVVFTPRFDPDRFIQGRRISYYNATLGRIVGRGNAVTANVPDAWFRDAEWALRLWRNVGGVELAGYGYWGRWKSPAGQDAGGRATFPRLNVYGASVRGQLGGGIANAEAAYYVSREDRSGSNPLVDNSQFRLLVGYERDLPEIARDLTVGVQYYLEWMMDHSRYERTLPAGVPAAEQDRHVLTVRLTKKLMNQNLILSLFTYYSPSDEDAYLRPRVTYKIDDHWTVEAGGNVFVGSHDHTFFGQFRRNTNVYAALRYAF